MQDMGKSLSRVTMDRIDVSNKEGLCVCVPISLFLLLSGVCATTINIY